MSQPQDRRADQPRVDRLVEAVLAVSSDLDLKAVLQRIVEVAVNLVDAQYGALGVVDEGGLGLSQFITVGIDDAGVARIGPPPTGHGVLGELLREPHPLRLSELAEHATSVGFPEGHPPMGSFLGVPVRVGQNVFGNLYLTEKRGGVEFTPDDERVVVALAGAAGVALQNARLYDVSRRRGAWMEAGRVVSTSLLSGTEREDVIALVVERSREVLGADVAFVALARDGGLHVETASGCDGPALLRELDEPLRGVISSGTPADVATDDMSGTAVPLGPEGRPCQGVLLVLWGTRPDAWDSTELRGFAAQAAVALELGERRVEAERFAIVQDRDRIGRDLHDLVIQRLFATGMQLQSAVRLVKENPAEVENRINRAVDELDGTIRELRSTIYGLQAPLEGRPSLRAQVLQVVDSATATLGFAPILRLDGLLDTLTTPEAAEHILATLREALSNVARHAHASHVEVLVAVRGSTLQLRVQDDGRGMAPDAARSGLLNLASRAAQLGGSLKISCDRGTLLVWQVPV
ncbi:MAG: devS [Frankiales bacterium]|nr:devS [Frankiales bacterium]